MLIGRKFYNLVINYLCFKGRKDGGYDCRIPTKLLLLTPHKVVESVQRNRNYLSKTLQQSTGKTLADFEKSFAFVTDATSLNAAVFEGSVSSDKIPCSHWWVDCVCHQLNTPMKSPRDSKSITASPIMADLKSFNSIVSTLNHTLIYDELEDCFKMIQESTTKFGTTYNVV